MAAPDIVMYEEESSRSRTGHLQAPQVDANAKVVFLVDKNGQQIAAHGDMREPRHDVARLADGRQRGRHRRPGPA